MATSHTGHTFKLFICVPWPGKYEINKHATQAAGADPKLKTVVHVYEQLG